MAGTRERERRRGRVVFQLRLGNGGERRVAGLTGLSVFAGELG